MTTYEIVNRGGRWAIVRVLPSGDAAGYDAAADRNDEQRHFAIHRDTPRASAIDAAFADSRQYSSFDEAATDLEQSGRAASQEDAAYRWACASQGCTMTFAEWLAQDAAARSGWESGAAGIPTA